jgi:hypothetical protein
MPTLVGFLLLGFIFSGAFPSLGADESDVDLDEESFGAEANPKLEPIGGGEGYRKTVAHGRPSRKQRGRIADRTDGGQLQ